MRPKLLGWRHIFYGCLRKGSRCCESITCLLFCSTSWPARAPPPPPRGSRALASPWGSGFAIDLELSMFTCFTFVLHECWFIHVVCVCFKLAFYVLSVLFTFRGSVHNSRMEYYGYPLPKFNFEAGDLLPPHATHSPQVLMDRPLHAGKQRTSPSCQTRSDTRQQIWGRGPGDIAHQPGPRAMAT